MYDSGEWEIGLCEFDEMCNIKLMIIDNISSE